MRSIKDKVAIIGMGISKFGDNWNMGSDDMIIDASYEAFEDAGVGPKDIQAAWVGNLFSVGSGNALSRPLKLDYIPITRCENGCGTGADTLRNACLAVAAGMYDIAMAVGFEKLKDFGFNILPEGMLGINPVLCYPRSSAGDFALTAVRYFYHYKISNQKGRELLAKIAVKNHKNGTLSPKAHFQRAITLEQAINAPLVAWPLGLFDCCPRTDGAAAAIICRADMAKNFRKDYVMFKGGSVSASPGAGRLSTDFDFRHYEETYRAAQQVYDQAGIKDPSKEISLAEVHDCFTITELLTYEDLQLCPRGTAPEHIDSGFFELTGQVPVNTDGGLKSFGHPQGASGIRMAYEIYKQLQGKAGKRQLKNPKLGVTHNIGGFPSEGTVATVMAYGLP